MPLTPIPAWLATLERDPNAAVADLFAGHVDRGQFSRLDDAEFLSRALAEPDADPSIRDRIDQGLGHWLATCHSNDVALRHRMGVHAYLYRLNEALAAIVLLHLPRSAQQLRDMHFAYRHWLSQYEYGYGDGPYAGYWRALAATQVDLRFQNQWNEFVVHADERYPSYALHIGLIGLRGLDLPSDQRLLRLLNALLRRAWQIGTETAAKEFARRLGAITADIPMANDSWRGRVLLLLERLDEEERAQAHSLTRLQAFQSVITQVLKPWVGDIGLGRATAESIHVSRIPAIEEFQRVCQELRECRPIAIEHALDLCKRHRAYAEVSGVAYFFVRTLCNLGHRVLQQPGVDVRTLNDLRTLLQLAVAWDPRHAYSWTFWAELEQVGGREDVAEMVLWETVRRFPEHEASRVELALLLQRRHNLENSQTLLAEAEQLLREAMNANIDHEHSRVELALLLQRRHKLKKSPALLIEAEQLLRQVIGRNSRNKASRNELARLLARSGRAPEALQLLAQWLGEIESQEWLRLTKSIRKGERPPLAAVKQKASISTHDVAGLSSEWELQHLKANAVAVRFAYARERGEPDAVADLGGDVDLARFYRRWFGLEPSVVEQVGVRPPYGLAALAALDNPENWERLDRDYPANAFDTLLLKHYASISLSQEERVALMTWLEPAESGSSQTDAVDEPGNEDEGRPQPIGRSDSYDQFLRCRLRATDFLVSNSTGALVHPDRSGEIDRIIEKHLARSIDADIAPIALAA